MTTPNSTTERGAEFPALIEHMLRDYVPATLQAQVRGAIREFAQSQVSAQGGERVEPAAIVVRDAEGGSWSEFDNEYDADEFYIRNRNRLIKPQVLFCYEAPLATPPATSGMKEAPAFDKNHLPDLRYIRMFLLGLADEKHRSGDLAAAINGINYIIKRSEGAPQDSLVGDAERLEGGK